jgi:hypothetical protein
MLHCVGEEKCIQGFGGGHLGERDNSEDLGIHGWIILLCVFKRWLQGLDSISLAEDRDRWCVFVNTVMNCRFAYNAGNF